MDDAGDDELYIKEDALEETGGIAAYEEEEEECQDDAVDVVETDDPPPPVLLVVPPAEDDECADVMETDDPPPPVLLVVPPTEDELEFPGYERAHLSLQVSPGSMPPLLLMSSHAEIAPSSSHVGGGAESPVCHQSIVIPSTSATQLPESH